MISDRGRPSDPCASGESSGGTRWPARSGVDGSLLALTLPLFVGAAACGRPDDPAIARGSTVVMAVSDIEAVKPNDWDLDFLTFLPLAKQNERGELEGQLARSWEHSPDHREYTFHLRTGQRWNDGVPVTAHDVKFTLDLLGHPEVAEYPGIEATVLNDSTVRIRAANPPSELPCLSELLCPSELPCLSELLWPAEVLALLAEAVHQVAKPARRPPLLVACSALEQVSERAVDVSVRQNVVGQGLHDIVLVHFGDLLGAVPTRVAVDGHL